MPRPRSIAVFECCYVAALVANILGPVLIWTTLIASVTDEAHLPPAAAGSVAGLIIAILAVVAALSLLLGWLVARRASTVARWIVAALLAYGIVYSAWNLITGTGSFDLVRGVAILAIGLEIGALVALFVPGSRRWFARTSEVLS